MKQVISSPNDEALGGIFLRRQHGVVVGLRVVSPIPVSDGVVVLRPAALLFCSSGCLCDAQSTTPKEKENKITRGQEVRK